MLSVRVLFYMPVNWHQTSVRRFRGDYNALTAVRILVLTVNMDFWWKQCLDFCYCALSDTNVAISSAIMNSSMCM